MPLAAFAAHASPRIAFAGPPQDITAIALLAPLALLGAQGVALLRRGAAAALDWFGVMTFTFFAALIWLGYVAMLTGVPPQDRQQLRQDRAGLRRRSSPWPASSLALALTLGWLYLAFFTAPSPDARRDALGRGRGAAVGHASPRCCMPWADYQKSYRSVALQLRSQAAGRRRLHRRAEPRRDAARGAQLPRRHAHACRWTARGPTAAACCWCRATRATSATARAPAGRKLADVGRPGDKAERYRLYRLEAQ